MSLQLILGGSGAGKTKHLFENIIRASIAAPEQSYMIIVPEQFTMQTQKDIVMMHPHHGTMNIDVVSFQRLAYRIFEELATPQPELLDDMGKAMVLRKVVASHKGELALYQGHLNQNGFVSQLKSMISEFYQYGITSETLEEMAGVAKTPLLKQKLKDFNLIFTYFKEYIAGNYITTEELLDVLCRVLPESEIIKKSVIALDGYTGFTPVQYRLIELCLMYSRQVIVTATVGADVDPRKVNGIQHLFYMSCHMVQKLNRIAADREIDKNQDIVLEETPLPRFRHSPMLGRLESELFRYGKSTSGGGVKEDSQIILYRTVNPAEEVGLTARQIQQMIREEGLRYRDIAVITSDLAGYGRVIVQQFEREEIPYFMDNKKSILENPMVELIRAALEILQKNFSYESVFRCLKTGLITDNWCMIERMENYVLALGIRGLKGYTKEWKFVYRGAHNLNLEELTAFRDQVLGPVFMLHKAMSVKGLTIAERTAGLIAFFEQCGISDKMEARAGYFESIGEHSLAKEYEQVYELVIQLLERLSGLIGEETVSHKEFGEILEAGFGEVSVGIIPATVDRVVVGDITRTRLNHIKVLFFLGVNDGIIPARKDGGSLLSDREREFFGEHHIELAPTAKEDSFTQRFYLYLMMTKPSRKLILSFSTVTADGKSARPSYLIREVQKIFPDLTITETERREDRWDHEVLYSRTDARRKLIQGLSQYESVHEDSVFLELYRWLYSGTEEREEIRHLVEAAFYIYEEKGIGKQVAAALYGNTLSGSVTRLEQYAACSYAHFLTYGLELVERQTYEIAAVDLGNLFHHSIDLCFKSVQEQGLDWISLQDEEREGLVRECVAQVAAEYGNTIMQSSARSRWLVQRVEQITNRTVWALQEQIRKGDFVPSGFEVSFSSADNLKAMKIPLSEEERIHLRGRIDRLDLFEDDRHVYVKIIDYKSGGTTFDLTDLYHGLQLQLVVYLDAVMELEARRHPDKEIVPAGLFYYNINDPLISRDKVASPDEIEGQILRELRMNGLVNSELEVIRHMDGQIEKESQVIPVAIKDGIIQEAKSSVATRKRFQALQDYVYTKVRQIGQEILDGNTDVHPYKSGSRTACDYCRYHSICGFDKKLEGYDYKRLKNMKPEEIWDEIEPRD